MQSNLLIFIVLVVGFGSGCSEPDETTLVGGDKQSETETYDIGIAHFVVPEGWAPNRSDGNTAVILTRETADRSNLSEMISIDIGIPASATAEESAIGFSDKFSGTVETLDQDLDGETAFRVSIPATYSELLPRECIVAHHNGKVCFLIAGSNAKDEIWPVLSDIADSWEWK